MENRYIKLDFSGALSGKKQLLSSEINIINLMSKINRYKILRNKEHSFKNEMKYRVKLLKNKLHEINSCFPEEEIKNVEIQKIKNKPKNKSYKKEKGFKEELEEIKRKLEKLES